MPALPYIIFGAGLLFSAIIYFVSQNPQTERPHCSNSRPTYHYEPAYDTSQNTKCEVKKEEKCAICFEKYDNNKTQLACGHSFHKKCIENWLPVSRTCPVCRKSL